ncbi:anti-apoptotic [Squirrelpox virus]|uniref:Anti-apoptotic n=1 Tax=Squirrelpox virus TaxID=240426 RepID=Q1HTP9_9POXV|nr:anti-apoptotic [Squirrelpox virus]ABD51487.1 C14R [Squirrelpox virus]CCD83319.1 anti-apoptotic [Squirrelpox virus]
MVSSSMSGPRRAASDSRLTIGRERRVAARAPVWPAGVVRQARPELRNRAEGYADPALEAQFREVIDAAENHLRDMHPARARPNPFIVRNVLFIYLQECLLRGMRRSLSDSDTELLEAIERSCSIIDSRYRASMDSMVDAVDASARDLVMSTVRRGIQSDSHGESMATLALCSSVVERWARDGMTGRALDLTEDIVETVNPDSLREAATHIAQGPANNRLGAMAFGLVTVMIYGAATVGIAMLLKLSHRLF